MGPYVRVSAYLVGRIDVEQQVCEIANVRCSQPYASAGTIGAHSNLQPVRERGRRPRTCARVEGERVTVLQAFLRGQQPVTDCSLVRAVIEVCGNIGGGRAVKRRKHKVIALEPASSSQRLAVVDHNPARQHSDIIEPFVDEWCQAGLDGDTHVIQIPVAEIAEEREMQAAAGASGRDVHRIVGISKRGRIHQRQDVPTGKGSRKIIGRGRIIIRKPKVHCIHLARHGRDGLIKRAPESLRREESRVDHGTVDVGISALGPTCEVAHLEVTVNNEASHCGKLRRRHGRNAHRLSTCGKRGRQRFARG